MHIYTYICMKSYTCIYIYIHVYLYKRYSYEENEFCTPCVKHQGLSKAQFRCNLYSELCIQQPWFFYTWSLDIILSEIVFSKISFIGCVSKHAFFFSCYLGALHPRKRWENSGRFRQLGGNVCACPEWWLHGQDTLTSKFWSQ